MYFNDDEQDVPSADSSGGRKPTHGEKLVRLRAYGNDKAPLEENRQQVMLELTDMSSAGDHRSGLDLVAVLDVSYSMKGEKLEKMKTAMQFIIRKLGSMDRLSIVSFSYYAKKKCPLRFMTDASRDELKRLVNELKIEGWTNISDGLLTGRRVLDGRRLIGDRVASIILMSDGGHNWGTVYPGTVNVGNVAVYTFGFGDDHDARTLDAIAKNSQGGTFNYVKDEVSLSEPFSQILAGLLSVVVKDLKLTVRQQPEDSKIEKVDPGSYPQTQDAVAGSFTVSYGDLYSGEVRKVIVDLLLPAVHREYVATVIFAQCSYSFQGKPFLSPIPPLRHSIRRIGSADPGAKKPGVVRTELARRDHANMLGEVSTTDVGSARDKLEGGKKTLDLEESNPVIETLKAEAEQLEKLTESPYRYEKQGRPYARSAKTSHDRQRFAVRGDVVHDVRPFATPRMDKYLEQARKFQEDPTKPLPTVDDDVKDEEAERERREEQARKFQEDSTMPLPSVDDNVKDDEEAVRDRERTWILWGKSHLPEHMSSMWARVMVILCSVLAIGVIVTGVAVFAVYLLYKPKMPYLVVSDARLGLLQYGQDGTIQYLQASITILAKNDNSKADASFSRFDLAMGFHGAEVALLGAEPFVVARESSRPLKYNVVAVGRALDPAGMQSMDESLKAGLVPLDLSGKARTRWKQGIFLKHQFWTRISCRLRFFFPGNGTVMPTDSDRCRSTSP